MWPDRRSEETAGQAAEVLAVHVGSDDAAAHEKRPFARSRGRAGDGAAGGDGEGGSAEENPSHVSRLARVVELAVGGTGESGGIPRVGGACVRYVTCVLGIAYVIFFGGMCICGLIP